MSQPATWRNYLALTKPGVVMLLMVTPWPVCLATEPAGMVPMEAFIPAFWTDPGHDVVPAINQITDQKIDAIMKRTETPAGGRQAEPESCHCLCGAAGGRVHGHAVFSGQSDHRLADPVRLRRLPFVYTSI